MISIALAVMVASSPLTPMPRVDLGAERDALLLERPNLGGRIAVATTGGLLAIAGISVAAYFQSEARKCNCSGFWGRESSRASIS